MIIVYGAWHVQLQSKYFPLKFVQCMLHLIGRYGPYWNGVIVPETKSGKSMIIAAHGNSLRSIVKHSDNMSKGS